MKNKNFEEYLDEYIKFYKEIRLNGYTVEEFRKLIVRNLQNIKRKYLKEQAISNTNENLCLEKDQRIIELESQLNNAIIPKFKIKQEVWYIRGKKIKQVDKGYVYGFVNDLCIRIKTRNGSITKELINVFNTKEEAKEKLKLLQGRN